MPLAGTRRPIAGHLPAFSGPFDFADATGFTVPLVSCQVQGLGKVEVSQVAGSIGGWWPGGHVARK